MRRAITFSKSGIKRLCQAASKRDPSFFVIKAPKKKDTPFSIRRIGAMIDMQKGYCPKFFVRKDEEQP